METTMVHSASPPATICWSHLQEAVFSFITYGTGHGVIEAFAGSAKTTTIVEGCKRVRVGLSVFYGCFARRDREALERKVPGSTVVSTWNAFGNRVLMGRNRGLRVDADREYKLALKVLPRNASSGAKLLSKLVEQAKCQLVDDVNGLIDLADEFECTGEELEIAPTTWARYAQEVLQLSTRNDGTISYNDQVWLPVYLNLQVPTFDVVFVDETQDLNRAQMELALKCAGDKGRVIAVGDRKQAIYGFRGADSNSMDRLIDRLNATVLPLSITYRCPRSTVKMAQKYVPTFEAAPNAIEGTINENVTLATLAKNVQEGDFVISRTNAPLVKICLAALREGKRAMIMGRDIGKGLAAMVTKSKATTILELAAWLRAHEDREVARLEKAEKSTDAIIDQCSTLHALSEGMTTVVELNARLSVLFGEAEKKDLANRIVCSTTHRAKGSETDRTWVLIDTYRPGRSQEEDNLVYVAVTRNRIELNLVVGVK